MGSGLNAAMFTYSGCNMHLLPVWIKSQLQEEVLEIFNRRLQKGDP